MRQPHFFGETRKSQKLFIKAGFRSIFESGTFRIKKNSTNMSTAICSANNIEMNLRQQIVRKRNTWDCM